MTPEQTGELIEWYERNKPAMEAYRDGKVVEILDGNYGYPLGDGEPR